MKILYISGTYCPAIGGAELSAHTLLKYLKKNKKVEVLVITNKNNSKGKYSNYDSIKIYGINHKNRKKEISRIISTFSPDFILTQLMWSDVALELAKVNSIKSILRVCKTPFGLDISGNSKYFPNIIISVSNSVKNYVRDNFKRDSFISPPAICFDSVDAKNKDSFNNKYILMFNPLIRKGGKIFKKISKKLPNENFAVVPGWDILRNESGKFDNKLIKNICKSLNTKYSNKVPNDVSFEDCENVKVLKPSNDVKKIFKNVRLLCVPSVWDEALGRVSLEGFANGIPVLGSSVGGLKEQIEKGGYLITNYADEISWITAINKFDNKLFYETYAKKGKDYIRNNYKLNKIVDNFYDLLLKNF
jgi:glycosyltransferase involved in cell wall biosynthesis